MTLLDVALIVDPDPAQCEALRRALAARWQVISVPNEAAAVEHLLENDHIAVVILDATSITQGVELARVAVLKVPTPLVVATHTDALCGADGFLLAKHGVRVLVRKPFTTDELLRAIDEGLNGPLPSIVPWVAPFVGRVGLFDFETEVRRAMVLQAVLVSGQSRSAAADLLRAPRPVIQRAAPPQIGRPRRRKRRA